MSIRYLEDLTKPQRHRSPPPFSPKHIRLGTGVAYKMGSSWRRAMSFEHLDQHAVTNRPSPTAAFLGLLLTDVKPSARIAVGTRKISHHSDNRAFPYG